MLYVCVGLGGRRVGSVCVCCMCVCMMCGGFGVCAACVSGCTYGMWGFGGVCECVYLCVFCR